MLKAAKYLFKTSELLQNELIEVQENWLDNPDTRGNVALANQLYKYIQLILYLKLLFLKLLKDMIGTPSN